jgi:hypothetical protein
VQLAGESAPLSSNTSAHHHVKGLGTLPGGGHLFLLAVPLDALEELAAALATSSNLGNVCHGSSRRSSATDILSLIAPHALSEAAMADKSLSNIEQNN